MACILPPVKHKAGYVSSTKRRIRKCCIIFVTWARAVCEREMKGRNRRHCRSPLYSIMSLISPVFSPWSQPDVRTVRMVRIGSITVDPPLLNSSSPYYHFNIDADCSFASTKEDLLELYQCPYTGAVTTRTSLIHGFNHDDTIHRHAFFDNSLSSINSYGYSPYALHQYITWIQQIHAEHPDSSKPFIISITGTASDVELCLLKIQDFRKSLQLPNEKGFDVAVEINLSCPNIPKIPPPAYSTESLLQYLIATKRYYLEDPTLTIGLKLPPYTYETQFTALISATWRKRTDQG